MAQMMKAALWTGVEQIEYREIPKPEVGPGQALIRVAYAGICGTDLMIYLGKHPRAKAPLVMSHEFSGTVVEAYDDAYAPGTPVAINPLLMCGECWPCTHGMPWICATLGLVGIDCDGGFAEYCLVPLSTIKVAPPSLPLVEAALVEPLAVAVHAVRASDLKVGDVTVVLGAGPVGNLTAQVARESGASKVFVSEMSPKRIAVARSEGLDVIDAKEANITDVVMEYTNGVGVPVVFETAGAQPTINQATKLARIGGQILQVGIPKAPPTVDMVSILFNEIRRTPIRVYRDEDVDVAVALAASGKLDLKGPATHILPLNKLGEAMEIAHNAVDACKILIAPDA